jgi:hypothetical protein
LQLNTGDKHQESSNQKIGKSANWQISKYTDACSGFGPRPAQAASVDAQAQVSVNQLYSKLTHLPIRTFADL